MNYQSIPDFPLTRLRRLRRSPALRRMFQETSISPADLIAPIFVIEGTEVRNEISAMPGIYQLSVDNAVAECSELLSLGIPAVLLFGIPDHKDDTGTSGYADDGIVQRAARAIKDAHPEMIVITDVCLCEYTSHGHCGVIKDGTVANDATLELLARQALSHAKSGADIVAPSDMMDGRVGRIRRMLDENGFSETPIMAYSAKYASAFYGPFREAAGSAPQFGDRKSYQMNPANSDEAMREVALDIREGADIVMVKPAMAYSDIIRRVRDEFNLPVAAYNVSGEYSMIKAAAEKGWIDGERVMMETLISIKRAGADVIITYFAAEAARLMRRENS